MKEKIYILVNAECARKGDTLLGRVFFIFVIHQRACLFDRLVTFLTQAQKVRTCNGLRDDELQSLGSNLSRRLVCVLEMKTIIGYGI